MAEIIIETKTNSPQEQVVIKNALQTIADNLDVKCLNEMAKLAKRPEINKEFP